MNKTNIQLLLLLFGLFTSFSGLGQTKPIRNYADEDEDLVINRDSVWGFDFDFSELDPAKVRLNVLTYKLARLKHYNDSMMNLIRKRNIKERSDSLEQLYHLMVADTSSAYNAYSFYAGQYHSNVSGLNKSLASLGWPKIDAMSYHYTNLLDFTWKRGRLMQEVFLSQGAIRSVTKNEVDVSYRYKSPLNYNIGYAIVDVKRVQFYPFAGLSYQSSELNFANVGLTPFELGSYLYDSLITAAQRNKMGAHYEFRKRDLMLNYGAELDLHLFYSKRKTGFIIGLRAGGAMPLLSSGWKLEGTRYSQFNNFNIRDYYFDVVFRIYSRLGDRKGKYYLKNVWWEEYN